MLPWLLFPALCPVVHPAKHLTVFGNGFSALAPRNDVVGFHVVYGKLLITDRANATLLGVGFLRLLFVERSQVQSFFSLPVKRYSYMPFLASTSSSSISSTMRFSSSAAFNLRSLCLL